MRGHAFGWVASGHSITVLVRAYWVVSKRNCAWLFTNWDLAGPSGHRSTESASPGHRVPSGVTIGWVEKHLLRLLAPPSPGLCCGGPGAARGPAPSALRAATCWLPRCKVHFSASGARWGARLKQGGPLGCPPPAQEPLAHFPCCCQSGSSNSLQ